MKSAKLEALLQQTIGQMRLQGLQRTLESIQSKPTVDRPYKTGQKTKSGIWVPSESDNRKPSIVAAMVAAQDARHDALDMQEEDSGSSDHHESA